MSRHTRSVCLGMTLLLALTGNSLAQDTPPIIWMIQAHNYNVESVSFSADGQTIVSAADDEAKSWQALDGAPLQTFPDHGDGVVSTDISPNGRHLAVGYIVSGYPPGGAMDLWDMEDETVLDTHGGCFVAFSPGGNIIASGGGGANRYAFLHRVSDGEQLASLYNGPGYITDVAFSPGGHHLAVSNTQNEIILWDVRTHTIARTLTGHTDDVSCIAFSPDGQFLAAGAGGWDLPSDSTIKLWRVSDGELLRTLTGHGIWTYTISFHPSGQLLASSGRDSQTPYSASMRFWSLPDGEMVREYNFLARDIAFSPGGESFCYGLTDGSLVLAGSGLSTVEDGDDQPVGPAVAWLRQNFPNPFNPSTEISFELAGEEMVTLGVYDPQGRLVRNLISGESLRAGVHRIMWNGRDDGGRRLPSGIYLYRLWSPNGVETRKMIMAK